MTAVTVKPFRGMVPRISDRLLAPNQATAALNCKITSGRLDPLKGLGLVHTSLATSISTIYRYRFSGVDNWLVWPRVVYVVKSPTIQDTLGRIFYAGDGEPRMTTYSLAISGLGPYPAAFYVLGVPPPVTAPSLAVVGGTAPAETRAYVYTFRTALGEESAPSPPVIVTGAPDGSWNLSALEVAPPNSGTVSAAATVATGVVEVTLDTVRGLFASEEITFAGVLGMTSLNGTFALTAVDSALNKVRVALDTAQTYTAGPDTWTRRAPHNVTGMTKTIWRTVGTNTDYKRVTSIAAATATYSDTTASTALGEAISTIGSAPPPKDMRSLVALSNGAIAGISGNQLCISEQYKPYSWPTANRYAFPGTGVALCAAENAVIVLTNGEPYVFTATVPEAASPAGLNNYAPCVAKSSVVDVGGGCIYASHDGLYLASPTGVRNLTGQLFKTEEWAKLLPGTFKASFFDQRYYAMHDMADGSASNIFVFDVAAPDSIVQVDERVDLLYWNALDGKQYAVQGNKIYEWDSDDANRYLSFWRSREYQFGSPINLKVAQINADFNDIAPANNTVLIANTAILVSARNVKGAVNAATFNRFKVNGSALGRVPQETQRQVQFSLVVDGNVKFTRNVTSSKPFMLPAGFKSEIQAFQIASLVPVHSVSMAQDKKELAQVSE
jgi:hypothetical protein